MISTIPAATSSQVICPICGSVAGRMHQAREMMLGTRDRFPYWECKDCGCLSLAEVPEDLGRYYPPNYYSLQVRSATRLSKLRDQIYLSPLSFLVNWRSRTDLDVVRCVSLRKSMSLLDVGCGSGHLLADLRELGYNATGVDPFVSQDVRDRFGVRVERKHLRDIQNTYDVVLFRHSLEHMPLESLRLARQRTKNDGVCVVCLPILGWAWQHYGTNWAQLDAPRHLFLHTLKSFELLANQSGFRVERVVFDSNEFQFWGSDSYQKDVPLNQARQPDLGQLIRLRGRAWSLNRRGLGDTGQFYLRPQ